MTVEKEPVIETVLVGSASSTNAGHEKVPAIGSPTCSTEGATFRSTTQAEEAEVPP
jgi:hypothetical protein